MTISYIVENTEEGAQISKMRFVAPTVAPWEFLEDEERQNTRSEHAFLTHRGPWELLHGLEAWPAGGDSTAEPLSGPKFSLKFEGYLNKLKLFQVLL